MAFHYSVALPLATASLPSFDFALKHSLAVYMSFRTREAVFRQLSALFLPLWGSSSTVGAGWSRNPGREAGGGAEEEGWQSRIQKRYSVGALFLFVRFLRCKSRFFPPQLTIVEGGGEIRQGTKAVIGFLSMINPTVIRKNPPTAFCLFAAAGRTGQRAQSPPTWKNTCWECLCCFLLLKWTPW